MTLATTLKAILDTMATAIDESGAGFTRLADSQQPKVVSGGYRLLVADFDRAPEFGIDASETLVGPVTAEFYRRQSPEDDDASLFAELSAVAKAIEAATYPSGTIAVIVRTRSTERNPDPTWIFGSLTVNLKWEQAY